MLPAEDTARTPFDAAAPSVVVLRAGGEGFHVGYTSSINLPDELVSAPLHETVLSVAIAKLTVHGFKVVSQSAMAKTDELVYTLVRTPPSPAHNGEA